VGCPQLPLNEQVLDDSGLVISLLRRYCFRYVYRSALLLTFFMSDL
jgi:hypothetical protein